ncbi:uncharacterized protein [Apostichopus japonicus]|uniref:uncharacterized protein n=1 Tax=Stichopus japonicus TaxID=307972 RepID=UPI003AB5F3CF
MRTTFERFCKEMQENPLDDLGTWRCGYVLNSAAAEKLKKQFEKSSSSRFVVLKSDGHFGKMRSYDGNQIIQWDYTGKDIIPFIHIGNKIYECHRGKDWKAKVKQEKKEARLKEMSENPQAKKVRKIKGTKKTGCPARIVMREVMMFPSFQANNGTSNRRKNSSRLKEVLREDPNFGERRFYVSFPKRGDHQGHHLDDSDRDDVILDPRLISRIHELQASSQVKTITDMKFLLKEFVTDVLCKDDELPHKKDRRFFPTVSDIRKVVQRSANPEHSKTVLVVHRAENSFDSEATSSNLEVRIIDDVSGKFEVTERGTPVNTYSVDFTSDNGLPLCSCGVWCQGSPPCEHFRAVFNLTTWGLENLPEEYRTFTTNLQSRNEYFVATLTPDYALDTNVASPEEGECHGNNLTKDEEEEEVESLSEMQHEYVEEDLLENLREKCREQLHRLEDLTHLVYNVDELSHLMKQLDDSVKRLEEIASKDSNL